MVKAHCTGKNNISFEKLTMPFEGETLQIGLGGNSVAMII
jgi:hypothetical protein